MTQDNVDSQVVEKVKQKKELSELVTVRFLQHCELFFSSENGTGRPIQVTYKKDTTAQLDRSDLAKLRSINIIKQKNMSQKIDLYMLVGNE